MYPCRTKRGRRACSKGLYISYQGYQGFSIELIRFTVTTRVIEVIIRILEFLQGILKFLPELLELRLGKNSKTLCKVSLVLARCG